MYRLHCVRTTHGTISWYSGEYSAVTTRVRVRVHDKTQFVNLTNDCAVNTTIHILQLRRSLNHYITAPGAPRSISAYHTVDIWQRFSGVILSRFRLIVYSPTNLDCVTRDHGVAAGWAGQGDPPKVLHGWVGHNAFGPTSNWPLCSLILRKKIIRLIQPYGRF